MRVDPKTVPTWAPTLVQAMHRTGQGPKAGLNSQNKISQPLQKGETKARNRETAVCGATTTRMWVAMMATRTSPQERLLEEELMMTEQKMQILLTDRQKPGKSTTSCCIRPLLGHPVSRPVQAHCQMAAGYVHIRSHETESL